MTNALHPGLRATMPRNATRGHQTAYDETAPRRRVQYLCPKGHPFDVPFALDDEVEIPPAWECRQHGVEGNRVDSDEPTKAPKPPRTHWDMLLERRSIPELEALLGERLKELRSCRKLEERPTPAPTGSKAAGGQ